MNNDDDLISRIQAALAAGPTPGPWMHLFGDRLVYTILEDGCRGLPVVGVDSLGSAKGRETLDYIAACSPDRIERLLAEVERLRTALAQANGSAAKPSIPLRKTGA